MNSAMLYGQLIVTTILTAISCCIPGTFLILRGTSLISDAISHAIFLGIVVSFLVYQQMYTPVLFLGGTCTALMTVAAIEKIIATKRLQPDAVIGITFPFLFSVAVILIHMYAHNIHLDIDAVLLGELAFSPFYQIIYDGQAIGSYSMWTMCAIAILNTLTLIIWYRRLAVTSFDPDFASNIGQNPTYTHWILMTITCITILGAFEAAGAVLVVAFIITPPATAYIITKRISHMIVIGILMSILGALLGCLFANGTQTSIAGSIATMYSVLFCITCIMKHKIRIDA